MNQRSLPVLILLNAVLVAALVLTVWSPRPAEAQLGAGGPYLMIAGNVAHRDQQAAIYVIDLSTSKMIALMFNSSNDKVELIGSRSIGEDIDRAEQQR